MRKIDLKVVLAGIFLILVSTISYFKWRIVSSLIILILSSNILTFFLWIFLVVVSLIHYYRNSNDDKNLISDKEGLEKPIDYVQFIFTYGAICSSIQVLAKETFAHYNFKEQSKCINFTGFDNLSFVIVIIVLIFYSYGKIRPIVQETFMIKNKIRTIEKENEENN
jgi:hypothetical protein